MADDRDVMDAFDKLVDDNSPENRKAFKDTFRKFAREVVDDTKRDLHRTFRGMARDADSPQVDMESPEDFNRLLDDE